MTCAECGMGCETGEFHPYAACLMFKACRDSVTVRANLRDFAQAYALRDALRCVLDIGARRLLQHSEITHWEALLVDASLAQQGGAAPEASGADYVMVPREPTVEMLDAMNRVQERHNGRIYAAALSAVANPAPPTTDPMPQTFFSYNDGSGRIRDWRTPASESGAFNALADDEAERQQYERDKLDPSNCLTTPTAEPRAAAQDGPEWEQFKLRFFRDLGSEQRRIVLGGLIGLPVDAITTHADEARILNAIRSRLQPSGAGEDAARLDWLESEGCDRFLRQAHAPPEIRWYDSSARAPVGSDHFPTLREAIDAARRLEGA